MLVRKRKKLLITVVTVLALILKKRLQKKKRIRRWWIKPWIDQSLGNLSLFDEFKECDDLKSLKNYLRMDESTFSILLEKIRHRIEKKDTRMRKAISAKSKLIITLRYLATGESFVSLQYNFRISDSTISHFIPIVCKAIYEELKNEYLKVSI